MNYVEESSYDSVVHVISEIIKEYLKTSSSYIKEEINDYEGGKNNETN